MVKKKILLHNWLVLVVVVVGTSRDKK
jgi:hypothetical protein